MNQRVDLTRLYSEYSEKELFEILEQKKKDDRLEVVETSYVKQTGSMVEVSKVIKDNDTGKYYKVNMKLTTIDGNDYASTDFVADQVYQKNYTITRYLTKNQLDSGFVY